jgi:hypothetical protein
VGVVTTLFLVMLQAAATGRATIVAKPSEPPRRNFRVVYYDESFLFAARNYGDARDAGGNTEPGLFVHSKERDSWVQITAISTTDGRFGKSTSDDPEVSRKLSLAPVAWDHTQFSQVPYVEQPLRTSGSIVFPERIEYDGRSGRYMLRYLSSWGVPSAETVLYIRRADLIEAFAKTPIRNR